MSDRLLCITAAALLTLFTPLPCRSADPPAEEAVRRGDIVSVEGEILSSPTNGNKRYTPSYPYNPAPTDGQTPKKSMMGSPPAGNP